MEANEDRSYTLNREYFLNELTQVAEWDCIIIGGGATGLGVAVDAASRGFKTLLVEQADFAKGTSSRSTKLVHGGVRYLAQGNISLVYEALRERGLLLQNAPHLVRIQSFIIPAYNFFDKFFYGLGLKIYDKMAGAYRLQKTALLSRHTVMDLLPNLIKNNLKGGIEYFDGQFDDARLAITLALTCADKGGTLLNYMQVTGLLKNEKGKINGVKIKDAESGKVHALKAKVVVNATGVFVDEILRMDQAEHVPMVRPSQGVHLVLNKSFLAGTSALMIPKTQDGRVLFAVPWQNHVLLGTTDTPIKESSLEPRALEEEINFILDTAAEYLVKKPTRQDILSLFVGLRPLAASPAGSQSTKEISRSHKLTTTNSGLITITGGKWTTYRKMAADTVDKMVQVGGLSVFPCVTATLKLHGYTANAPTNDPLSLYGTDAHFIQDLITAAPALGEKLHTRFSHTKAEVIWIIRNEMARTIEDVLARRLRVLFLDARVAMDMAPEVGRLLQEELNQDAGWLQNQIKAFNLLANSYLPGPSQPVISFSASNIP